MTLDPDPEAPSRALEVAHEGCLLDLGQIRTAVGSSQTTRQTITDDPWAGLPEWAHPLYKREAPYGWESGAGTARDGGGWDFHEWDPWQPAPDSDVQPDPYIDTIAAEHVSEYDPYPWAPSRLADTGDVMDARLAADVAAELHRQDADAELFLVGLAERHGLAVSR